MHKNEDKRKSQKPMRMKPPNYDSSKKSSKKKNRWKQSTWKELRDEATSHYKCGDYEKAIVHYNRVIKYQIHLAFNIIFRLNILVI